jgi:MFS family permease
MIFIIVALSFSVLLLHALPYLLMFPDFVCYEKSGEISSLECTPQTFCGNPSLRAEKVQNKNAISNWISDFDMTCVNPQVIMSYWMILFTGIAIGGVFIAPICDKIGRKLVFLTSLTGLFVLYSLLLYSRDYHDTQYSLFFYGVLLAQAMVSGMLLIVEMIPKSKMPLAVTIVLTAEALVTVYICAYFKYFSYGWRYMMEASAIMLIGLTLFIWIFVPESLRYHYDREEFEVLDSHLRKLAHTNGSHINGEEIQGAKRLAELKRENPGEFPRERLHRSPYDVLLENPIIFINLMCLIFIWAAATFNYFLVEYYLRLIKQDLY